MTATTKTPLGASTLNRKWYLDVNTGSESVPVWTGVFGITEFKASVEGSLQDDSDFDSAGWKSQVNTANTWKIEGKVRRGLKASDPTVYDPGQEVLRLAAANTGEANIVQIRYYEMGDAQVEAYSGKVAVTWAEDGGNMEAVSTVSFTLNGRGARNIITHPAG